MMYIELHNDSTGDAGKGNYDVQILINGICIWKGRVEGHDRSAGWRKLVADLARVVYDENTKSASEAWY